MKSTTTAVLLILALSVAPASAQIPDSDAELDAISAFVRQFAHQIEQLSSLMRSLVDSADAEREFLGPILDRAHSAQALARRIESLAAGLPSRLQMALRGLANRLRSTPAPRRATPPWVIEQVITSDPTSETARQVRTLDQVTAQNATALAVTRSAAEAAQTVAQQVAQDLSPQMDAQAAILAARELAQRAQTTPSTRAAMQLLVEAVAAQLDHEGHAGIHMMGRQAVLIQQQTLVSLQLAAIGDQLAAVLDQQNAQQKDQLARRAAAAASIVESQRQTYGEITHSLLALHPQHRRQAIERFFTALIGSP